MRPALEKKIVPRESVANDRCPVEPSVIGVALAK
jgi:hypothetical protein